MPRSKLSKSCQKKIMLMHQMRKKRKEDENGSNIPSTSTSFVKAPKECLFAQPSSPRNTISVNKAKKDELSRDPILTTTSSTDTNIEDTINVFANQDGNSTEAQKPTPVIEGRRLIDILYFFTKLKEISNHGPMNCGLQCVEIVGEKQYGLFSKFTLESKLCNLRFTIENDSPEEINLNNSAVAGIISIGCGLSQLQELLAALNVPVISANIYKKTHKTISDVVEMISLDSMNEAAKKEREIAVSEGRVDVNNVPIIDVIVDGCWSKRTYKKNYSALSGAAAIIGKRTGEVLFLGVRNKYCCICAVAQKMKLEAKPHKCYKNYSGPSTGMESDILLEGFKCSIEMHNIIYGRMISDGDSNTYAKILKNRPYPHITVEKIECRNHILRNLCNKLVQLQTDTKYLLKYRKQVTSKKIMILRKTIRIMIKKYKTDNESQRRSNIEPLYTEILLAHLHAFGDHSRCRTTFCTQKCVSDQMQTDFFTSNLWSRICSIMSIIASHAQSLIHDIDSNLVERYNSIVAKLVGGKRINFSLKGSYQTRCQAAVVSFNSHKLMSRVYKCIQGKSPRGKIRQLEESRYKRMTRMRKVFRKKIRLLCSGNDGSYGEQCEKPDMPPEIFKREKELFLMKLHRTEEERIKIERETILQSSSSQWMEIRRTLLTASNFGTVIKKRNNTSCANLVKNIIYVDSLAHVTSIKHGCDNEKKALLQLEKQVGVKINPCGLFIDENIPFLGASPDGVMDDDTIVEIKCPITAFKEGIDVAIKKGKLPFYKLDKNGFKLINKSHNWFYQMQGQLHITRKQKCLFGLWYGDNVPLQTELIFKDTNFWETQMVDKLKQFYIDCLLPELIDPRLARNMKIRDPIYIENAIKEKEKKAESKKNPKRNANEAVFKENVKKQRANETLCTLEVDKKIVVQEEEKENVASTGDNVHVLLDPEGEVYGRQLNINEF